MAVSSEILGVGGREEYAGFRASMHPFRTDSTVRGEPCFKGPWVPRARLRAGL